MTPYPVLLDALHERTGGDPLVASATGVVLSSTDAVPGDGDHPLARFGVAVARSAPAGRDVLDRFADGLLDLHRDLLRRGIDHAVRHLSERTSGGSPLLDRQLVQAALADVAVEIRETAELPASGVDGRWRTHRDLVAAGRLLLSLLGASSFVMSGPGADLYLAEVAGNVYLHPDEEVR